MSWRQQLSVKHMKFWRTLIQLILVAKLAACNDLVAAMLASRDFKGIRRKRLPIFMLGADHAFQASFERQTPHSPPASSGHELARI